MTDTLKELKTINASLVKELTGGLKQAELHAGEDMLGLASVEVRDSDKDIVRVKGINYKTYHDPEQGKHLKLLAGHQTGILADGTPPIVGRIERFFQTTVGEDGTPALAFAFSFAKDAESGELTPLAKAYKSLMPKYINSFSVGMMVDKAKAMDDGMGIDITDSSLYEVSVVAIPANAEANALSEIKKAFKKESIEIEVKEADLEPVKDDNKALLEEDEEANTSTDMNADVLNAISEGFAGIERRLDSLESTLAIQSEAAEQTDSPKSQHEDEQDDSLKEIQQALEKLKAINKGK